MGDPDRRKGGAAVTESWKKDLDLRDAEETLWERRDQEFDLLDDAIESLDAELERPMEADLFVIRVEELEKEIDEYEEAVFLESDRDNIERNDAIKKIREKIESYQEGGG